MINPDAYKVFEPDTAGADIVNLREELLAQLREFRITLKLYGIEVLYGPLPVVSADLERVERFFRTAIGRIVQFSRGDSPVVSIEARPRETGIDLIITARKGEDEHLLVVGHFPDFWYERA